jgi:hypothetical protein
LRFSTSFSFSDECVQVRELKQLEDDAEHVNVYADETAALEKEKEVEKRNKNERKEPEVQGESLLEAARSYTRKMADAFHKLKAAKSDSETVKRAEQLGEDAQHVVKLEVAVEGKDQKAENEEVLGH